MDQQVKIGPEFFAKIKLDYADWRWALVREFLQNCFDAPGCKTVSVTVECSVGNNHTVLTVANDGAPMTEAVLKDKLLTLGGSGKNFEGENTGGFGVAKSLLYYTHQSYAIRSGQFTVTGRGAQYSVEQGGDTFHGTESTILLAGDEAAALREQVRRFAAYAQWRGTLTLDGQVLSCGLHKGARRKDLGWGVVYTNQSFQNLCVMRLNGQPMFTRHTRYQGCVLIELAGKAKDVLTSNRDGLLARYAVDLQDFLTSLAVDKRSALREQRAEYRRWKGEKARNEARKPKAAEEELAEVVDLGRLAALVGALAQQADPNDQSWLGGDAPTEHKPQAGSGGIQLVCVGQEDEPAGTVTLGTEFILKNTTGKKVPSRWTPGEKFCQQGKDLVRCWTALLLRLHQLRNRSGEFSVGFVFDDENEAEAEQTSAYGWVYYINPVKDGKPRFGDLWRERHGLISLAAHEFVHGALGLGEHDEDYADALTDVLATCVAHASELGELCWCGEDPRQSAAEDLEDKYLCAVFMLERQEAEISRLEAQLAAAKNNSEKSGE
jgi:hypothetical protein